jgi:carboxyl-terminal processing protease
MGNSEKRKSERVQRVTGKGTPRKNLLCALGLVALLLAYPLPFALRPRVVVVHAANIDSATVVSATTREGRLAVFDDAWERINERYYDRTFHGLDWDAQRTSLRARAAEAGSSQELYAVLRRMIAPLNDPHTRVFGPEEKSDWWRPRFVSTGLAVAEVGGEPTVVKLERGSGAQRAGLRVGDVIKTVAGSPALSLLQSQLAGADLSASERFRAFAKLLEGPPETSVAVSWQTRAGKEKSARLERHWEQRELGVRTRREQGIAVIELDAFTKPIAAAFARDLKQILAGTRGVILDLRGNGGGDAEAMTDIASSFLAAGSDLGHFTDRFGVGFTIATHSRSLFSPDSISPTKLPLIVLTSERTSSAAEIFVAALKVAGRARILGTETCGCVLAVRTRHELPDGGLLDISEMDYVTAAGQHLERHGIQPDETVVSERADLYAGRDRTLDLALNRLKAFPRVGLN